jgi:hypothetical protein
LSGGFAESGAKGIRVSSLLVMLTTLLHFDGSNFNTTCMTWTLGLTPVSTHKPFMMLVLSFHKAASIPSHIPAVSDIRQKEG